MSASDFEIDRLARDLAKGRDDTAVAVASLVHLSRVLFRELAHQRGANFEPLLALQCAALRGYLRDERVAEAEVIKTLQDLERAGTTAGYLQSLPD